MDEPITFDENVLACRPSSIMPPPKIQVTATKEEKEIRDRNVELYAQRIENNQNLWTGEDEPRNNDF